MVKTNYQFLHEDFQYLTKFRRFNMILPLLSTQAQSVYWGAFVRIQGVKESTWEKLYANERLTAEDVPVAEGWWDVCSVRDCEVHDVQSREWGDNFGPRSVGEWMRTHGAKSTHIPVRVVQMQQINPQLKEFNNEYGKQLKHNGR